MTARSRYLEQELQDGVVAVETEEFGHSFGVQDFECSVWARKKMHHVRYNLTANAQTHNHQKGLLRKKEPQVQVIGSGKKVQKTLLLGKRSNGCRKYSTIEGEKKSTTLYPSLTPPKGTLTPLSLSFGFVSLTHLWSSSGPVRSL